MKIPIALFTSLLFFLTSCSPSARQIEYGSEECFYCKMSIVDPQHAAELVTAKGKVFVFDAIECMVNHYNEQTDLETAFLLVNDYQEPTAWLDADKASFLISPELPSPMGANLNAFSSLEKATEMQTEKSGKILNWENLLLEISK